MLLRFAVSNRASIRKSQDLSMVASAYADPAADLIRCDKYPNLSGLPVAAIYGGNASGKSNFVKALQFMMGGIRQSATRQAESIGRHPFALDPAAKDEPSRFECDFIFREAILDRRNGTELRDSVGVRFQYGFSISDTEVLEEWLYAFPHSRRQLWFHRSKTEDDEYVFGKALRGRNSDISKITERTALFLSSAARSEHPQLSALKNYFDQAYMFRTEDASTVDRKIVTKFLQDELLQKRILEFLSLADLGVTSTRIVDVKNQAEKDKFIESLGDLFRKSTGQDPPESFREAVGPTQRIELGHKGGSGEDIYFRLANESRGTRALLNLIGWILLAIDIGGVIVVDELDSSLHPLLSWELVKLFTKSATNPHGAQLIFSTHDTTLLNTRLLRRDQIWFTEKTRQGETSLYPLSSFKSRLKDALEKGYLEGRYGAIPFMGHGSLA